MIFRKFLIISRSAPPAITGGAQMMYNLLRYFPEDSFCVLTSNLAFNHNREIEKEKWLKAKYFYFDIPTRTTLPKKAETCFQKFKDFIERFRGLKWLAQTFLLFYLPFNIIRLGRKIINEENIDLILCYPDTPLLFSTYFLHKITKKPFFLYFYDLYYGNKIPLFQRILAYFLEPKVFKKAEKIFVMDEALQEYYQKRYKREIFVIPNSVPIEKSKSEFILNHQEPYKIIYTGTISWPQANSIKNLIKAIEKIKNFEVKLYLYTPHNKKFLNSQGIFESKKVVFTQALPFEIPEIQRKADILFVPLSFNTKYPLVINTSSPGKTYEYLVSGRPILIHAPKNSYLVEYAKKYNFALVVDEENIEKLKEAVEELITNKKLVEKLINNAWQTAILNHDAAKNSKFFQRFFFYE